LHLHSWQRLFETLCEDWKDRAPAPAEWRMLIESIPTDSVARSARDCALIIPTFTTRLPTARVRRCGRYHGADTNRPTAVSTW
jgi:hypothetical protein